MVTVRNSSSQVRMVRWSGHRTQRFTVPLLAGTPVGVPPTHHPALNVSFLCQVSLEFSPSSAVPGEETILQVKAQPDSLCGLSAVDQSVLIKEPGKTLQEENVATSTQLASSVFTRPLDFNGPSVVLSSIYQLLYPF